MTAPLNSEAEPENFHQDAARKIAAAFNADIAPQSNLARALELAELGLVVFPCRPDKAPYTPNGFKNASADPDAIRAWWTRWPDALVGLPTGRENGIAVADLDIKEGKDWRISARKAGLLLPVTHTVKTRSGGEHRYYRYPADVEKITSSADLFKHLVGAKETGIDVRADCAYVIAWEGLNEQILGDLAEWPTAVFADAERRNQEAGKPQPKDPREPRKEPDENHAPRQSSTQPEDLERAREALRCVPADDREDWVSIGMVLKEEFGKSGRDAWNEWSRKSDKYNQRDQDHKWESFNGSGRGLGTLFYLAEQHGYRPPPPPDFSLGSSTGDTPGTEPPKGETFDSRFTFTNIGAITKPILDGVFAIDGLLLQEGIAAFYGPRSSGKSFGTLRAMLHIATGRPYNGRPTEKSHVVYFAAEGGQLFQNRVLAAKGALEIPDGEEALELVHAAPNLGLNDKDAGAILKAIEVQRKRSPFGKLPLIVVIDTLARTMKGAKEDETVGTFIANCEIITSKFGGLAIAVHHSGKDASKGLRGWSGLGAALENEWRFARLANGKRQVVVDKVRDGQDGIGWEFEIESVKLGENKHKRPVTTCVVRLLTESKPTEEGADKPSAPARERKAKYLPQFKQAFTAAILDHPVERRLRGPEYLMSPKMTCVDREYVRTEFYGLCSEETQDTKQKAFVRILAAVFQDYPQETDEAGNVWIWSREQ
jgi:hypothetical protein